MDPHDLAVRNCTYTLITELGRVPSAIDVANHIGLSVGGVRAAWRRLHDARCLVLDARSGEILMANPFSAVPTPFRVHTRGRRWYANCAWDAFGICAALATDGTISTVCADCDLPLTCSVVDRLPGDPTLVFHCEVPAARWWDDIVFT